MAYVRVDDKFVFQIGDMKIYQTPGSTKFFNKLPDAEFDTCGLEGITHSERFNGVFKLAELYRWIVVGSDRIFDCEELAARYIDIMRFGGVPDISKCAVKMNFDWTPAEQQHYVKLFHK